MDARFPRDGGCACGAVRYRLHAAPIIVHCCHCRDCQRQTGTAFALNALVEREAVEALQGEVELVAVATESGRGQRIARCPACRVALWSHYGGGGEAIRFVRVGTLDDTAGIAPDVHIYTRSKLPWVRLPDDAVVAEGFYDARTTWTPEAAARYAAAKRRHGEPLPPWLA